MEYIDVSLFGMKWRFTEKKYNLLPQIDLTQIKILSEDSSKNFWNKNISDKYMHYKLLDINVRLKKEVILKDCGWGDKETESQTKIYLERLNISNDEKVLFFWDSKTSVETTWGILLKYWTDFCYPSDDGNIIIINNADDYLVYEEDILLKIAKTEFINIDGG